MNAQKRTIEWIPTAMRTPTDEDNCGCGEFLVMIDCGVIPTTLLWDGTEFFDEYEGVCGTERQIYRVTHWANLPDPPEREKHGE